MGYNSAIQSVENVTKSVMRLPRFMRSKLYQDFIDSTYDSNDLNLEYFEKWLAKMLTEMFNPIAAITETRENAKQNHSDKNKDNKHNRQQHSIFQMSGNKSNTDKQQFNFKCLFCNINEHKVSLCPKIKDLSYPDKIKTIKDKKTLFQLVIKCSLNKQM